MILVVDRIAWAFLRFLHIVKTVRHSGVFLLILFLRGLLDAAESDGNMLIVSGACTYTNLSKTGKVLSGFRGHFRLSTDFVDGTFTTLIRIDRLGRKPPSMAPIPTPCLRTCH